MMKNFYFLTLIMLFLIPSTFAQKKLHQKEHERPERLNQKLFEEKEKKLTKNTKGYFLRDSTIRCSFTSESDSLLISKAEYEYDSEGKSTLRDYNWDTTNGEWIRNRKIEAEYNANGKWTSLTYNWDSTSEEWIKNMKVEAEFNSDGKDTLQVGYNWNSENEEWINVRKTEYEYDSEGKRTLQTRYYWDSVNMEWVNSEKTEYGYDSEGKDTLQVNYNWDSVNEEWINVTKTKYGYDTNGKDTLQVNYNWDSENEEWINATKTEFEYDSEGYGILQVNYNWDSENEEWINVTKIEQEYNSDGNRILSVFYNWDSVNEKWTKVFKDKSRYLTPGIKTLSARYKWDTTNQEWNINYKTFNYYSGYFAVSVDIEPGDGGTVSGDSTYKVGDEVTLRALPDESYKFVNWTDNEGNEVSNDSLYTFNMPSEDVSLTANFESQTGNWEGEVSAKIDIYPNPAKENINVEADNKINRIVITNVAGGVVYNSKIKNMKTRISTAEFISGIYILRIYTEQGIFKKKLLIQK